MDTQRDFQEKHESCSFRGVRKHHFQFIQKILKIYHRGKPWSLSAQMESDAKPRDIPFLDKYASERWECVLHYMVGSQQQQQQEGGISADAVRILLHAGLMKR
jgi:Transcription factor Tfb2